MAPLGRLLGQTGNERRDVHTLRQPPRPPRSSLTPRIVDDGSVGERIAFYRFGSGKTMLRSRSVEARDACPDLKWFSVRGRNKSREKRAFPPATPVPKSDRAFRYRTRATRAAKSLTSGAVARPASMTLASDHPAPLSVHSGIVTGTAKPEGSREMSGMGVAAGTLMKCCSGKASGGPKSNPPVCQR